MSAADESLPAVCECGRAFACSAATGRCWCFDRPAVVPVPGATAGAGCLCPACLDRRVATITVPGRLSDGADDRR